jgi:transposase-like protein
MKRSRYTEEQIIGILQEQESGAAVAELCRKHGMSDATFYKWKSKYGRLEVSEAKRLRALECCATNRMRSRIASPENVPQTSSVASPPVFPLPH